MLFQDQQRCINTGNGWSVQGKRIALWDTISLNPLHIENIHAVHSVFSRQYKNADLNIKK